MRERIEHGICSVISSMLFHLVMVSVKLLTCHYLIYAVRSELGPLPAAAGRLP